MEIKEGNYIRTKKGIAKILEDCGNVLVVDKNGTIHDDCSFNEYVRREDIIDVNKRIIQLIKEGDYVNGYLVNFVYNPNGKEVFRIEIEKDTLKGHIITKSENIKSVVTKEQIESIKYEVK